MNRQPLVLAAAVLMTVSAFSIADATDAIAANPEFCARYADRALMQQSRNRALGCGYYGPRWHRNWGAHFAWCVTQPRWKARREMRIRRRLLRQCRGPVLPQTRTFLAPRIGGVRLDWCRFWARQCGAPAANAFCRARGYRRAVAYRKAVDVGRWEPTRVIGSGRICSGSFCDGFRRITCER